jgi:2-C-methyl-D-erythritol 4-phosphate cytidylyltransferase
VPTAPAPEVSSRRTRAAAVILAAGDGRRSGHQTNKVLLPLAGRRVFTWSIRWARLLPEVCRTIVVIREEDRDVVLRTVEREVGPPEVEVVVGSSTRHGSEWEALQVLAPAIEAGEIDVVVIHDAARPLAGTDLWAAVIDAAARTGGAIPADEHGHLAFLHGLGGPEQRIVAVQTPQAFSARPLLDAYRKADIDGFVGTDTASCIERYGSAEVQCLPGDPGNIKVTFPDDLFIAERLLAKARWDLSGGRDQHHHGQTPRFRASPELRTYERLPDTAKDGCPE